MLFTLKATLICGLNRKVKDKAVGVDFQRPFDILLKFKALQNDSYEKKEDKKRTLWQKTGTSRIVGFSERSSNLLRTGIVQIC